MSDEKRPHYGGMGMLDAFLAIDERKQEAVAAEKRAAEIASAAGVELRAANEALRAQLADAQKQLTEGRAMAERLIRERDQARERADLAHVEIGMALAALGDPNADLVEAISTLQLELGEAKRRIPELIADRDTVKTWCVALYAHVCRLTGKRPERGPKEISEMAANWTAQVGQAAARAVIEKITAMADDNRRLHEKWMKEPGANFVKQASAAAALAAFAEELRLLLDKGDFKIAVKQGGN